jgi:hypothetical protein
MRLLQEKRDLLQQLIAVETRATGCTGNTARRYSSDNHSVFSNSSGVSSLTYATFATNSQQSQRPAPTATKKVFVPKLNIS